MFVGWPPWYFLCIMWSARDTEKEGDWITEMSLFTATVKVFHFSSLDIAVGVTNSYSSGCNPFFIRLLFTPHH